jgi:hypothetical protein
VAPPGNQAATEKTNINLQHRKKPVYSTLKICKGCTSVVPSAIATIQRETTVLEYIKTHGKIKRADVMDLCGTDAFC